MASITGNSNDRQVLLINEKNSEAIILGIEDLDNATLVVMTYLQAVGKTVVYLISHCQYSVDGENGFIIKYKKSEV